jgi:Leucine-rich repeat (LRR) protein
MTRSYLLALPLIVCLSAYGQTPEEKALNMVRAHNGTVLRDEKLPGQPVVGVIFEFGRNHNIPNVGFDPALAAQARKAWEQEFSDLRGLTALRHLDLGGVPVTDANLEAIKDLEQLQHLDLYLKEGFTDAGFKHIGAMKNLVSLNIGATRITDAGLKHLKGLVNLEDLGLLGTHVTDAGVVDLLKELKALRKLTLGETKITDATLKQVGELKDLEELRIDSTPVTDAGMKYLKELKGLKSLNIHRTKVGDAGIKELGQMQSLEEMVLGDVAITDAGLEALKGCKALKQLRINDSGQEDLGVPVATITAEGLADIKKAMPGTKIIYYNYRTRSYVPRLRSEPLPPPLTAEEEAAAKVLRIRAGRFVRDEKLPGQPVVSIRVGGDPQITDAELKKLTVFKELRRLDMGLCRAVTGTGFAEVKKFKHLEELNLLGTSITDAALADLLKELKELRTLRLSFTNISDAGLVGVLPDLKNLRMLELEETKITDRCLKQVGQLNDLKSLGLENTRITDVGLQDLKDMPALEHLSLAGTKVTDRGVRELNALKSLQALDLDRTAVTDACLQDLKEFKTLANLHLGDTAITQNGLNELRKAMPQTVIAE